MNRVVRVLAVGMAAGVSLTCSDNPTTRGVGFARIPLAPRFITAPAGGPSIDIDRIRAVLRSATDSAIAEALITGDSAILEFQNVVVHGDSSQFQLNLRAFDGTVLVFEANDTIQVKPGDNTAPDPELNYVAPDAAATSIKISTPLLMDWAGSDPADVSCLSRLAKTPRVTSQPLSVTGKNVANGDVAGVRVGWTSRDTTVFTVDTAGVVKSRCSNKSAYLVARTFLNVVDSVSITVKAEPFSLLMTPDSSDVGRGATRQLTAIVVDENNNSLPATTVTWNTSDATRATVSPTGLVTAISNGRVLITAGSGGRTTVGVIRVVAPEPSSVIIQPKRVLDSIGVGQARFYVAKGLDAANKVIPDATGFVWSTNFPADLNVGASTGIATGVAPRTGAYVKVLVTTTTGVKRDSVPISVLSVMPPGGIKGKVTDANNGGAPLAGVTLTSSGGATTTTAADGSYTLTNLQNNDDITLTKTGYVTMTAYSVPVFPFKTIEVPAVSMSPTGSVGNIFGKVVNALSGNAVSGVTVRFYSGVNGGPTPKRPNVTPTFTTTSGANGTFSYTGAAAGVYTLLLNATGYSDAVAGANAVAGKTDTADVLFAPAAVGGGIYVVLTWGDCTFPGSKVPCDLDAHMTGPKVTPDTGRFQVFSGSTSYLSGPDTIAALDVSDNNSRGPEIIGLRPSAAAATETNPYRFYVHNVSGNASPASKALADSAEARVDVYQDGKLIGTFFPPSNLAGTVWHAFNYDGARLIPIENGMSSPANPAVLALRAWDLPADLGTSALQVRPRSIGLSADRR